MYLMKQDERKKIKTFKRGYIVELINLGEVVPKKGKASFTSLEVKRIALQLYLH